MEHGSRADQQSRKQVVKYLGLLDNCAPPDTSHLPSYGVGRQRMAEWKCPVCKQRWTYDAVFMEHERMSWVWQGSPSRKWHKAEAARLKELEK